MSESGHSQPGMYGQGRRRRRRRGDRDAGPPGQNLSGPSRDREYQPRERRVHTHNVTHTDAVYVVFTARLTILLLISTSFFFFLFFFYFFYIFICSGWQRGSTRATYSEDPNHSCKTPWRKGELVSMCQTPRSFCDHPH